MCKFKIDKISRSLEQRMTLVKIRLYFILNSKTPNNNSQDDLLALKNLSVSYPNNIIISKLRT